MAEDKKDKKKKSKGGKVVLFVIIMILLIVAGVVALFYFNIGGMRDKYLNPILVEYGLAEPTSEETSLYADWTEEDFLKVFAEKDAEIEALKAEVKTYQESLTEKSKEIDRLKLFEDEQLAFKEDKKTFDENVVYNDQAPSIENYKTYYEMIYPDKAEELYKQVVGDITYNTELKDYVKTYEQMDEKKAAEVLTSVSKSDMDLVILILENSKAQTRAAIMENMDASVAARIAKSLAPVK